MVHRRHRAATLLVALLSSMTLVVTACGGQSEQLGSASTGNGEFPITISHAFGETTIEESPQRVATWGWGSADAAIALGVTPVAIQSQPYGGDENGMLPWVQEALDEAGEAAPTMLPEGTDPPFEAIAAAAPDLILAVYSGITETDYEQLSQIAPTVAYPDEAWSTPWRDTIRIVGEALGKTDEADALLADIDAQIAAKAEEHPELAGKSVAMVFNTPDAFYVYKPADARVAFTLDLGLVNADSVDELANGDSTFYYTLSDERLGDLESDILVSYADTAEASAEFLGSPEAQLMGQVQDGRVAEIVGTSFIAAVSPPTALSLTWGLDEYVAILSETAQRVGES
ncbi:iron-siderophore ABC transporter substrate-binding protein [Hoyosella sp. G463]|uniref:Iron-siderophore ABC transporter substrate-binding protein n=1 Tax=Lolliginicoccus lacisalsi TaxID=2742202 RepID=A0A927JDD4_9ACTN|nr:iron-siderophore ABC transporter substrate-binding protein [Lolliginicoccus lacisalsi]MBD8507263.1 iron-siderophore ABC transporter substrate-binding protein [Lolliginicoccus lacisalsi]